jgi:hypothetical protein
MEVFADARFLELVAIMGNHETAIGRLISFWMVAQKYWKQGRKLVPLEIFNRRDWAALVDVGLAEIRGNEVYAKGSEQSFDWLLVCKEAGKRGGKKSASLRSRVSKGKATVSNLPTLTPSLTLTPSPLPSVSEGVCDHPSGGKKPTDGSLIWSAYSASYLARYRVEPKRNQTTNSQCAQLAKRLGPKDGVNVVRFYLTHNNSWYVQHSHTIGLCLKDAEALYTQMLTDNRVTNSQAKKADAGSEQADIFARVTKRLLEKHGETP